MAPFDLSRVMCNVFNFMMDFMITRIMTRELRTGSKRAQALVCARMSETRLPLQTLVGTVKKRPVDGHAR